MAIIPFTAVEAPESEARVGSRYIVTAKSIDVALGKNVNADFPVYLVASADDVVGKFFIQHILPSEIFFPHTTFFFLSHEQMDVCA